MKPISRIAPTPSGYLHLGNALSFILTWLLVRKSGGTLHLRIDDLDGERRREAYIEDIFRTLEWLGIDYDKGPSGPEEFYRAYSQQDRIPGYEALLASLRSRGVLFACTCSRREIQVASPDGRYPGTCYERGLPFDAKETAWRIRTPESGRIEWQDLARDAQGISLRTKMRDFVVRRKDGIPAYQIASLADDLAMGVNLIVRGEDLLASSAAQLFLAAAAGQPTFSQVRWLHHPLLTGPAGEKLSKSQGAPALQVLRENRESTQHIFQLAAQWLGMNPKTVGDIRDLLAQFIALPNEWGNIDSMDGS